MFSKHVELRHSNEAELLGILEDFLEFTLPHFKPC